MVAIRRQVRGARKRMLIREATKQDMGSVRRIHFRSFPEAEREPVAELAVNLLGEASRPATLSLVAEEVGGLVGHVAFSPVSTEGNSAWSGYILAPLAVVPEWQKRGVGSGLVKAGLDRLTRQGVNLVFVYGDPAYYGRFLFEAETAETYAPPHALQYPFGWQARVLHPFRPPDSKQRISCVPSLQDPGLW